MTSFFEISFVATSPNRLLLLLVVLPSSVVDVDDEDLIGATLTLHVRVISFLFASSAVLYDVASSSNDVVDDDDDNDSVDVDVDDDDDCCCSLVVVDLE